MKIAHFTPRKFLPEQIDLTQISELAPIFTRLSDALSKVSSKLDLEEWLKDFSEYQAAMSECGSLIYIAMTCQTDDPEREKAYMHIVEVVDPWLKPRMFELKKKLVSLPAFEELAQVDYYNVLCRSIKAQVELYREENVARETEIAKLCQTYQKISGAMSVTFEDKEQTLVAMGKIQEEVDRSRRQAAWEAVIQRRLQDVERLETLFEALMKLRHEIALAAGFQNYRDYMFVARERFDYTPEDCVNFHNSIEKCIVPLVRELHRERQEKLGLTELRPWDLAVDPENRAPLRPFKTSGELMDKTQGIFNKLDARLGNYFELLLKHELVDLDNRKGKAPGGYQSTLTEARVPFIFMNAVGVQRDLETLFHEGGHAFHALACREQPLHEYREGVPIEFAEVASMSMELLVDPHLGAFYPELEAKRARKMHLEGVVKLFPWVAMIDAFQHWIYMHPEHSRQERRDQWTALAKRFGGLDNWAGYDDALAYSWHRVLHIFEIPFYFVEYGIAQLGALQLWQASRHDLHGAIDAYLSALSLGGSKPLPQLFSAAGLKFDFGAEIIGSLMAEVKEELATL